MSIVLYTRPIGTHCLYMNYKDSEKARGFLEDKDTISEFEDKFHAYSKGRGIEVESLTFQEKFVIYKKDFPEYKVWDYCRAVPFKLKREAHALVFYNWVISTSGEIWNLVTDSFILPTETKDGYLRTNNVLGSFMVHRLVMSTFCSDIKREGLGVQLLTVNHIDAITTNNELLNLEWLTDVENALEMSDRRGLSKPLKATSTIKFDDVSIGDVFYLEKRSDVRNYGGSLHHFGTAISKNKLYKGFIFEDCMPSEVIGIKFGFPRSVSLHLFSGSDNTSPSLKLTLVEDQGEFKKGDVVFFPRRDRFKGAYFVPRTVRKAIASGKPYLGCIWENTIFSNCIDEDPIRQNELFKILYKRRVDNVDSSVY